MTEWVPADKLALIRDYEVVEATGGAHRVLQHLAALPDGALLEFDELAAALGFPRSVNPMDYAVAPRGYRVLSKIPRLPEHVVEHVVGFFNGLEAFVRASIEELEEVEGVGNVRAREIREGLRRLQEQNLVDRYLNL
jgi:diadenylate cyclase